MPFFFFRLNIFARSAPVVPAWLALVFSPVDGVRTSVRGLVGAGEEPVFALYLNNRVYGKLTIVGVNSAHYTGDFVLHEIGEHQLLAC